MIDDSPQTRQSLVVRLGDPGDREAWTWFVETYAPLVHRFLLGQGVQDADARDVAQEVFMSVAADIHQRQSQRPGAFRSWLYTTVRHRAADYWRRQRRQPRGTSDTRALQKMANLLADDGDSQQQWEREYLRRLFAVAAERVKDSFQESTWQAFWRTTVDQEPAGSVAADLQLSVAAVYMAKRRVWQRMQQEITSLEDETK